VSTSTFFHYKYLWRIADDARVRAEQFSNEHNPGNFGQGLVAILFAAAAAEAFINEVTYSVRQDTDLYPATAYHSLLVDFAAEMRKAVADREPLEQKYLLASTLLGQPLSKGRKPLQELVGLNEARNFLVHLTPEPCRLVANLEQRGIATKREIFRNYLGEDEPVGSQVDALSNPTVAEWACDAAKYIILAVGDMFPAEAAPSLRSLMFGFPPER
jgi:hypothetical protein